MNPFTLEALVGNAANLVEKRNDKSFYRKLTFKDSCQCGHVEEDVGFYQDNGEGKLSRLEAPTEEQKLLALEHENEYIKHFQYCNHCRAAVTVTEEVLAGSKQSPDFLEKLLVALEKVDSSLFWLAVVHLQEKEKSS